MDRACAVCAHNQGPGTQPTLSATLLSYSCLGRRQVANVLELAAADVAGVKFAGGSCMVMPEPAVLGFTQLCHHNEVCENPVDPCRPQVQCECC